MEFIKATIGGMAFVLALAGRPLLLLCLIQYELRKEKRN